MTYLLPISPFFKEVFIMIILFLFTTVQQIEQITERYTVYYWAAKVQPGTQEERLKLEICT